jgi:predicted outer membrane repeat protein
MKIRLFHPATISLSLIVFLVLAMGTLSSPQSALAQDELTPTVTHTPISVENIRYVRPIASGMADCQNWENACTLQTALVGVLSGDEIWAAAGTYKPTIGADRAATFQLKNGVAIYGGFVGTETELNQRNPALNVTILSGDIDNNDSQTPIITNLATVTGNATNSYHVVSGATGATLDGFTITAGNAATSDPSTYEGGGMRNYQSNPTLVNIIFIGNKADYGGGMLNNGSSPTLKNVIFSGNRAVSGGGIDNFNNSNPILTNVTFIENSVTYWGGGIHNAGSNPILTNVTFSANSANNGGGGIYNNSGSPVLTNVTFSGNFSTSNGGGIYNYTNTGYTGNPILTNVTFSDNSANNGGGIFNSSNSNPQIRNVIFWGNTAATSGAQIYNSNSTPNVIDSVVQGGCPVGSICTNIITADPMLGTLDNYGGFTWTIPLLMGSSAIDTGNDIICPSTDQRGVVRPQGQHCDLGAFEYVSSIPTETATTTVTTTVTAFPVVTSTPTVTATVTDKPTVTFTPTETQRPTLTPTYTTTATMKPTVTSTATATVQTYIVSGALGVKGAGATVSYAGSTTTADNLGNYFFSIPSGWIGFIMPSKAGYRFLPSSITIISPVTANLPNQNFTTKPANK